MSKLVKIVIIVAIIFFLLPGIFALMSGETAGITSIFYVSWGYWTQMITRIAGG